ncbi:cell division protein FtsW [Enterococcus haemoperoxidus ATCC BAA-382]|uniref:Probable peptidoglycan glycosyltransferase FtsW n=1 Tax=Enterococcus haemoperoxidus ATCC BAA-382 TaxID=1158608 RepID=R2QTC0_9ENTE|nr:FtsW/RodA/SpoVE family cell cycle protein [Enterococcus haemoperoxidus]EOH99787.1 cell division protein FtsW [Enterococcus haemoperoxidus ATCC BAA-382]EOT62471.1 cell division protein FtsW [Enterococcus haemoperoxidus ATCC BAA-382]
MPNKIKKRHLLDYSILIPYLVLSAIGLIMVYSSTSSLLVSKGEPPTGMVVTQLQFWLLSLVAMFFIYKMKTTVFQIKGFIMFAIVVISVLLLAVRFTKLGAEINGAKGWIQIGSFSMQPAEYLKIMVIWYLAYILGRRQKYIDKEFKKAVFRPMLLVGFLIFLVAIQPDLGNAAILTLLVIIMVLASGVNYMYTYLVGGVGIIGSIAVIQTLLLTGGSFIPDRYQYVYQRFAIFLNPFKDERNAGHQLANSYFAINNGGWFGKGLGNSIQKKGFLPEAHSDFIFAITIEELGLLVSLMILAILMFMIARIILVGVRSKKPFNSLMCIGIGSMLLLQVFINLGGITGVIPLTGVTFPFLSQGGNSVLIISIAVAFVLNISADEKKQKMDQEYQLLGN